MSIFSALLRAGAGIGGFLIGGPAGAAAGSGLATKLTGGSWTDALKGAALAGIGGEIGQGVTGGGWNPVGGTLGGSGASAAASAAGAVPSAAGTTGIAEGLSGGSAGIGSVTAGAPTSLAANLSTPLGGTAAGATAAAPTGLGGFLGHIGGYGGAGAGLGAIMNQDQIKYDTPQAPTDTFKLPTPMPLNRTQTPYAGDLTKYGTAGQGGEHRFFDDINPQPRMLADGGAPMQAPQMPPNPMNVPANMPMSQAPGMAPPGNFGPTVQQLRAAAMQGFSTPGFARGGAIDGDADGRADNVPAMLSPGEHIVDAMTISQLGGGNNAAGQKMMEHFKTEIRRRSGQKNPSKPSKPVGTLGSLMRVA